MHATTIGLDIAKSVFQVHGEDATGKVVLQKRLRRAQVERHSLPSSRRRWSASRPAARRITGRAAHARWATRCG